MAWKIHHARLPEVYAEVAAAPAAPPLPAGFRPQVSTCNLDPSNSEPGDANPEFMGFKWIQTLGMMI